MQDSVKLKKSLFGFSKSSVLEYINGVSKNIDDKLFLKDNEILKHKKEIEELKSTIEDLKKTIADFEDEKSKISQMYINAESRAEAIVKEADEKAAAILRDAQEEIKKDKQVCVSECEELKLKAEKEIEVSKAVNAELKAEISALQSRIKITLNKFDSLLSDAVNN